MSTGVGKRIKEARIRMGLRQEDLALKMGKSKSLISKVENGLDNMTTDKIMEYAKALETTPGYLMGWTPEAEQNINKVKSAIMNSKPSSTIQKRINDKLSRLNKEGLKMADSYMDFLLSQEQYIKTSSEMVSGE